MYLVGPPSSCSRGVGVVRPGLTPEFFREHRKREDVGSSRVEVDGGFRDFVFQSFQHSIELGLDRVSVRLVPEGVQQRLHPRPQILKESHPSRSLHSAFCSVASDLPCPGKGRCSCLDKTSAGVTGDEFHAGQTARGEQGRMPIDRHRPRRRRPTCQLATTHGAGGAHDNRVHHLF